MLLVNGGRRSEIGTFLSAVCEHRVRRMRNAVALSDNGSVASWCRALLCREVGVFGREIGDFAIAGWEEVPDVATALRRGWRYVGARD